MTFEIITRFTPQAYQARCGKLRSTCTAGAEWAAKALATKLINHAVSTGEMMRPAIHELTKTSQTASYDAPETWRLTLKESL